MIEQWIEELEYLSASYDPEAAHERADEILCEVLEYLGHKSLVEAYNNVEPKWYA